MAYRPVYEIEVTHSGLNKYRHIRGTDRYVVEQKAAAQKRAWDEMWDKKKDADRKRQEREDAIQTREEKKQLAIEQTENAEKVVQDLENILSHTLTVDDKIDWDLLVDKTPFPERKPVIPKAETVPRQPRQTDPAYKPNIGFIDKIFAKSRNKKEKDANRQFQLDKDRWDKQKKDIEDTNKRRAEAYARAIKAWEILKVKYAAKQKENNEKILEQKQLYHEGNPNAISDYCEMVLSNSSYPDFFPQEWDLEYQSETKVLIVDYSLPDISKLPTLKAVKYVASRDDFSETHLSVAAVSKLYDILLYQVALRTIHELYEADVIDAL